MPNVTFIQQDGEAVTMNDAIGTLMEIATHHDVEGIVGRCGGVCSCSTCHVYIPAEWQERVGPPGEAEKDTLELNDHVKPNSRLGCQIELTDDLDGLVVHVAPEE